MNRSLMAVYVRMDLETFGLACCVKLCKYDSERLVLIVGPFRIAVVC